MKVAIVGAGIFGCIIAIDLAAAGFDVTLCEERFDILDGTSGNNHARLHMGYHYPRSDVTAMDAKRSSAKFVQRFPRAVEYKNHWYMIAPESKVTPSDYLDFLKRNKLPFEAMLAPPVVHTYELAVKVPEGFINVPVLRSILAKQLQDNGVHVHRQQHVETPAIPGFDCTVWATYGVPWLPEMPLRYEVCEVAIMQLGRYSPDDSYLVLDGDFCGIDPRRDVHLLYDVKHSVHYVHKGTYPEIPAEFNKRLEYGHVFAGTPADVGSNYKLMLESASRFFSGLEEHGQGVVIREGSMWSLRAVLPNVDSTDARPTIMNVYGDVLRVLGGKMTGAIEASESIVDLLLERDGKC